MLLQRYQQSLRKMKIKIISISLLRYYHPENTQKSYRSIAGLILES